MNDITRVDRTFVDTYGVTIHFHVWSGPEPRAAVQIVHGIGEYALRYDAFARELASAGYVVYAADLRGHGATGLGQYGGDHSRLGRLGPGGLHAAIAAVLQFTRMIHDETPGLPFALFGHSMGSLFAQKLIDADAAPYDAVILSGTAYRTVRHMNGGDLNARHRHLGTTGHEWLSRDPEVQKAFAADPLTFDATVLKLWGLADTLRLLGTPRRLNRDVPMLIMIGEEDPLGGPKSVELLANAYRTRGGLSDVTVTVYPEARHETLNELNRAEVYADVIRWLDARLDGHR
ncbi:alpha/beta fold hydrolase [Homoserinibacter sp. GY 40078]|uniref:alpha/beta fold hydrolase n=1 Tax=Homoserinibacter sp. GY 40078 TaxID=2603275 RepID=UPI0011CAB944|nr:alpha/beta hydrolase [Homoserinibacter sp. GY 40078]TXK19024.1 alpha/beta hydrolase [Homoserinibacter sp. GY 40078]